MRTPAQLSFLIRDAKRSLASLLVDFNGTTAEIEKEKQLRSTIAALNDELNTVNQAARSAAAMAADAQRNAANFLDVRKLSKTAASFRDFVLHGEHRDLLSSGSAGSLIPQEMSADFYQILTAVGPIAGLVTRRDQVGGRPAKFSVVDATSLTMAAQGAEGTSWTTALQTPTINAEIQSTDTGRIAAKASYQFLEDSAYDVLTFLNSVTALPVARNVESILTVGRFLDGSTAPNQPAGGVLGATASVASVGTTQQVSIDDLNTLRGGVDAAWWNGSVYMCHSTVVQYLASAKDSTGKALYQTDPVTGNLIHNGHQIVLNQALPVLTSPSGTKGLVLFGNFAAAYGYLNGGHQIGVFREAVGLPENLEVGFNVWSRVGGVSLASNAVKAMSQK
jgi:HK97 family phage major capsid protein